MESHFPFFLVALTCTDLAITASSSYSPKPSLPAESATWCNFSSAIRSKFSREFLDNHCKMVVEWRLAAKRSVNSSLSDLLTPKQLAYFDSVASCRNVACICHAQRDACVAKGVISATDPLAILNRTDVTNATAEPQNTPTAMPGYGRQQFEATTARPRLARTILDPEVDGRAVRKEYRMLTDDERRLFHQTLSQLRFSDVDGRNQYEILTLYHNGDYSPGAHFGAAFLPFHREMLLQLEVALRLINPSVAIPYWDSTLDAPLAEPKDSIIWTEEFLGNENGPVDIGPFASWTISQNGTTNPVAAKLQRNVLRSNITGGALFTSEQVERVWEKKHFRELTYCVDRDFEMSHFNPHNWVGGNMAATGFAPNDPVFFLHHSFVDYIWEHFRMTQQLRPVRETEFVEAKEACNSSHEANAQMKPFPIRNKDGLSNNYTDRMFRYASRPTCTDDSPDCGSTYLFCDKRFYRCVSKVRLGGSCAGFEEFDICFGGICIDSVCSETKLLAVRALPSRTPVWLLWSEWSPCSKTCVDRYDIEVAADIASVGPGRQSRFRVCTVFGQCAGISVDVQQCGSTPCPTAPPSPVYAAWSAWSPCSATCGEAGQTIRTRNCSMGAGCVGEPQQTWACPAVDPCAKTYGDPAFSKFYMSKINES